jgi:serine/threonine protein phosphatase PrpC
LPIGTVSLTQLPAGSRLVLTSDGIHDNLMDSEIGGLLARHLDVEEAARALVTAARRRSEEMDHVRSKDDDLTALVVGIQAPAEPDAR